MSQRSLFPEISTFLQLQPERTAKGTAGVCGRGPDGETCGSCRHLARVAGNTRIYLKCGLMRAHWTRGAGSDIRAKWSACEYWTPADTSDFHSTGAAEMAAKRKVTAEPDRRWICSRHDCGAVHHDRAACCQRCGRDPLIEARRG